MNTVTRIIPTAAKRGFTFHVVLASDKGDGPTFFVAAPAHLRSYTRFCAAVLRFTGRVYRHPDIDGLHARDRIPAGGGGRGLNQHFARSPGIYGHTCMLNEHVNRPGRGRRAR